MLDGNRALLVRGRWCKVEEGYGLSVVKISHLQMSRTVEKTNFVITRHGEITPVVRFRVDSDADMIGKRYALKGGYPIFKIEGNSLTERKIGATESGEEWFVEDVLAVENQLFHPSTWKQGSNIFVVNSDKYVHFEAIANAANVVTLIQHDLKKMKAEVKQDAKETMSFVTDLLLYAILIYLLYKLVSED